MSQTQVVDNYSHVDRTDIDEMKNWIDDAVSSGYGDFEEWHEKTLTELIGPCTPEFKKELFAAYYESEDANLVGCTLDEIQFMAKLCGVKKFSITLPDEDDEY